MSFFNKVFMTKAEVTDTSGCILPSQFQIGEPVGVVMDNELEGSDPEAEIIQGIVVSITFDVGQVRYGIGFPIEGSNIYVVVQYLRANMVSLKNGASNFSSVSKIRGILRDNLNSLE
jgi:hypothetical protein